MCSCVSCIYHLQLSVSTVFPLSEICFNSLKSHMLILYAGIILSLICFVKGVFEIL